MKLIATYERKRPWVRIRHEPKTIDRIRYVGLEADGTAWGLIERTFVRRIGQGLAAYDAERLQVVGWVALNDLERDGVYAGGVYAGERFNSAEWVPLNH